MIETTPENDGGHTTQPASRHIHGLLVRYQDDGINACVHSALKGKKRVYYKCMDVQSNLIAFGTSVGAIYLFRTASINHSACKLALVLPCDQGPIEAIKFVPNNQANNLLVVIGTARGSLVIFQLNFNGDSQSVSGKEIYRAEKFTRSETIGIKFIEHDQDLLEPWQPFTKLYICDQKCRIFVLDSSSIFPAFPLLYNNKPTPVLDVIDSEIHQIFVHRSQLLLSTDERTQVFKEYSTRPEPIGKTQRKRGFYGACFFNSNYKPARMLQQQAPTSQNRISSASQQSIYSSTASLADLENLIIFVARPKFSLWQVNYKRDVLFTHKFEPFIRSTPSSKIFPLVNETRRIRELNKADDGVDVDGQEILDTDNPDTIYECFEQSDEQTSIVGQATSDHFEKLIPIFSTTLGNLLLSHTRNELFVIDPMSARLVVWHHYEKPIQQVCCSENEIFVLFEMAKRNYQVDRVVLLAPTQFVLELHRLNRRLSLMAFVEMFSGQFRSVMALPLSGMNIITTEGGLLRNILWSVWRDYSSQQEEDHQHEPDEGTNSFETFKGLVDEIVNEGSQLRQSIVNLTDSQIFFTASNDNIERLCTEPYASMVSLDINIDNLHTNHVVHFSQDALNRQKSLAKLSQSIMNLSRLRRTNSNRQSLVDLHGDTLNAGCDGRGTGDERDSEEVNLPPSETTGNGNAHEFDDKKVFVEPMITKKSYRKANNVRAKASPLKSTKSSTILNKIDESSDAQKLDSNTNESQQVLESVPARTNDGSNYEQSMKIIEDPTRCPGCGWPKPRAHLKPMHHSQQIQFGWLQENLLPNFEENIEQIESRALRHGLWHLVLRCLAFKNKLEEYINCCIMLDDVRLLNMERFVNIKCSEEAFIDLVFKQLEYKQEFLDEINNGKLLFHGIVENNGSGNSSSQRHLANICLRCKHMTKTNDVINNSDCQLDEENIPSNYKTTSDDDDDDGDNDDISFNLVNLFKKIMIRRGADVKRAVETLLKHPKLLDRSKIPASFYLEALSNQCSHLRRTRLKV
jgi:hypothetical protein